ncbi:metallophosphoesterase [Candidatus Pacearchaeota archaeon]|nr:metallophosphoesterase [Candidatus Pacearchaeota archaeon]
MDQRILKFCLEKGVLVDSEVCQVLEKIGNLEAVKKIIESFSEGMNQKVITKSSLLKNSQQLQNAFGMVVGKTTVEKIWISLGINIELSKERKEIGILEESPAKEMIINQIDEAAGVGEIKQPSGLEAPGDKLLSDTQSLNRVRVLAVYGGLAKKVEVDDFVKYFRTRFNGIKGILQQRQGLNNLTSINKIGLKRQELSIIGLVYDKRITKNKNMILEMEDNTGKISVLVNRNKEELYNLAKEILLDDVIGIRGMGDKDFVFVNDIFYPDSLIEDKLKIDEDESAAFISDIHVGSKMFLKDNLLRFINWINGGLGEEEEKKEALKVKYLFIVGDTIDGVGVYPAQEKLLELPDIEEQYKELAKYLKMIRKDITIILCPGQHDAVRVAEPQPPVGRDYGAALYDLSNLILVSNPSLVEIGIGRSKEKRGFRVLMYHGASFHNIINEIDELRLGRAHDSPTKVIKYLLKRRHLSPTHSFNPYIPHHDRDPMFIDTVPDIVATGDLHKLDIDVYNNILMIASSCWQSITPFEEKMGNHPDPCKVPVFNMKTRKMRVLDFSQA